MAKEVFPPYSVRECRGLTTINGGTHLNVQFPAYNFSSTLTAESPTETNSVYASMGKCNESNGNHSEENS